MLVYLEYLNEQGRNAMKAFIVIGFVLFGYLLPELIFIMSPNYKEIKRLPVMQNVVSSIALGCVAMGVF